VEKTLADRAEEIFAGGKSSDEDLNVKELDAKTGRLAMENDFFISCVSVASETRAQNAD
jgi:hypothetical protein